MNGTKDRKKESHQWELVAKATKQAALISLIVKIYVRQSVTLCQVVYSVYSTQSWQNFTNIA